MVDTRLVNLKHNLTKIDMNKLDSDVEELMLLQLDHNLGIITLTWEQRNIIISPYMYLNNYVIIDAFQFEIDRVLHDALIEIDSNLFTTEFTNNEKIALWNSRKIVIAHHELEAEFCKMSKGRRLKDGRYMAGLKKVVAALVDDGVTIAEVSRELKIPQKTMRALIG